MALVLFIYFFLTKLLLLSRFSAPKIIGFYFLATVFIAFGSMVIKSCQAKVFKYQWRGNVTLVKVETTTVQSFQHGQTLIVKTLFTKQV